MKDKILFNLEKIFLIKKKHLTHFSCLICEGRILLLKQLNARMNKLRHEVLRFFGTELGLHAVNQRVDKF